VVAAILFYAVCILLFIVFVRSYTKHGESITVPDVRGKTYAEATSMLKKSNLEFRVADSSYSENQPPLAIIDQTPTANSKVKEYRTIYLTVNAKSAPEVKMPDLKDASLKQATMILESYGIKTGKLIYSLISPRMSCSISK
jgi:beta-lactam-binding protein with PASTA domain